MKIQIKEIHTAANYISFFRLLLGIPIFILLDYINDDYFYRYILFVIYVVVFITDILDGYLARKFYQVSELGKIIDPLADKVLVIIIIIKLFLIGEIPTFYFWVIVLRDVLIFSGGIYVSRQIGKVLPSNLLGKITVISIGVFIIGITLNVQQIDWLYYFLMYISLILSFASIAGYSIRAVESLKWYKNEGV